MSAGFIAGNAEGGFVAGPYRATPPELLLPPYPQFSAVAGLTPGFLSRGDEASGSLRDAAADALLAASGTGHLYQRYRAGRQGIATVDNASGWNADILDFANTNSLFGGWIAVDNAVAAQRDLLGRSDTVGVNGVYCKIAVQSSAAGGGLANCYLITSRDGFTTKSIATTKVATDGVPRLVLVHRDRTMNLMRTWICGIGETPTTDEVDITAQGSVATGTNPKFTVGFSASVFNGDDSWYGGILARINADMTGSSLISLVGTRLLTYAQRGA